MKNILPFNYLIPFATSNTEGKTFRNLLALFVMVVGMNGVMGQVTIASQDFESTPGTPTLSFTNTNGTNSTGTNGSGIPASANLFVSGSRGWQSVNTTSTLTFANQSLSGYTNAFIDFRLAGMSVNGTNGIDGADLITVSISVDGGTTYSSELTIGGSAANQRWDFTASGTSTITYDGNNTPTAVTSSTGIGGISTVTINIPNANSQVRIKIVMKTNDADERYVIDDVRVRGTVSSSPTITVGTLSEFTTSATSTPSAEQTLVVSGTSLTNDILIVPPTGFEISTVSGGGFTPTNPITITAATANAGNTNVYVRYNPASLTVQPQVAGTNISVTSTGATTQNVTVLGSVRNLSQGDFAVIGFNCSSTDAISFVALTSIPANTIIKFTDNGYSDATTQMLTEGYLIYTAPSTISAGTVVSWNNGMTIAGTGWNSNAPTNFSLNSSGEQLFAFQGTWGVSGGTTTLHQGFMTGGTWTTSGSVASVTANSYLPTGLTTGTNAADFTDANAYYTNNATNTVNTRSTIFTRSSTAASWTTNGSLITTPAWVFNIIADEPTTQPSFSAATTIGNNQLDLNFSGGNGTSYMVVMREASAVTASPTDATNYSLVSGSVNFASATELSAGQKIVYNGTTSTGTVTITNLSAGTTYYYAIYAYNGTTTKANFYLTSPGTGNQLTTGSANSNVSDIIIHSSFTEPNNIAYASTQENSNLIVGNSVEVAQFSLRDGGATTDADANSTTLNAITFTIANHTNLRRLALYDGSTELSEVAISSGTATFSGLTLAAGDNLTKDFSLRASFAGTVTDNSQFSFTVSSVTADIAGSTFATADAGAAASSTTGDRNKIEVTADRLTFIQQTSNVSVNTIMSPAPTVSANDALANRDLDYVTDMTATTTGTFGSATTTITPTAGLGTFSNLQFSAAVAARTIAVSSGSLIATGNSNTFNVTILIVTGDIAFIKYQSDAPDEFSIITFVDIPASQTFYFTDNQWTTASGPLATNEQTMTWTTPGTVIPAGTVITFSNSSGSITGVTPSGNGTASLALNGLSASGDQIFMYKGTSGSPSQFICGLNFGNSGAWQTSGGADSSTSFLPTDLTNNVNAISFASDLDNGYYGNTKTGSIATLKSLINNGANWTRDNALQIVPTWSFNINSTSTTISGSATVQNLSLASGETFSIGANTLTINGSVTGSGTLSGGATSNLTITGTSGTINFDQTTPGTTNVLKNLTISGSGTTTLGNALNITAGSSSGVVTVGTGATLTTGGFLTFKSDANGTASFGNSAGTISGNVTVERYIPANKRSFRFLTSAVTTSTSIKANWQENVSNTTTVYADNQNPNLGYGTHITGTGGSANGFDTTTTNNPSMYAYTNGAWAALQNTNSNFTAGTPYRLLVRGDRSINMSTNSPSPTPTVLRATGTLHTGNFSPTLNQTAEGFSFVGNPYQATVDIKAVLNEATNMNTGVVYYWDPTLNARGGYVTRDLTNNNNTPTSSFNQYLQPGQAVFVKKSNTTLAASMTFTESNKSVANAAAGVFRNANTSEYGTLRVNLQANTNNQWQTIEGSLALFNDNFSWNVTSEDATKMSNLDEEVSFVQNNTSLAIACQPNPSITDELPIRINNMRHSNYQWQFDLTNYDGATPYLFDAQNNTYTEIADGSIVPFMADVNTVNRFKVVFQNAALSNPEYGSTIVMYPNPAKRGSSFILQGVSSHSSVVMYNTLGQTIAVSTKENEAGLQVTPIALVSTGVYIVSITSEGKTSQVKWIVE